MTTSQHTSPAAAASSANAAEAPHEQAYQMEFRGSAGQYTRIWFVNLLLSVLTLGVYSAWAKVRNKRYLYGNTYLDGANFDYTAKPLSILIGRILILIVILGGAYWAGEALLRNAAHTLLLLLLLPWALVRSYAFNARYTFYRNVGFSFIKTLRVYGGFYLVYAPIFLFAILQYGLLIYFDLPLSQNEDIFEAMPPTGTVAIFAIIALIALLFLLLLSLCVRASHTLKARHMCWGKYQADFAPASYIEYFFAMMLPLLIAPLALILPYVGLFILSDIPDIPDTDLDWAFLIIPFTIFGYPMAFATYYWGKAMFFRFYWHGFVLPEGGRIRCNFSAIGFAVKILLFNALAIGISFGLLYPWAQVRKIRYLTRHTVLLLPSGALQSMVAENVAKEDSIGEEFEAAEGLGFGIDLT